MAKERAGKVRETGFNSKEEMAEITCCEQEKYISEINGMMAFCYAHRIKYTGPPFKFCPFCGEVLSQHRDKIAIKNKELK